MLHVVGYTMAKKILYIEDEIGLQKTLGGALEEGGFSMLFAPDGASGVLLAKKERPDLILLDLILPKKNGFEVLKELKADKETAEIPVIVMTNLEGPVDVKKVIELGATTFLVKANYSLGEMVEKVKQALE